MKRRAASRATAGLVLGLGLLSAVGAAAQGGDATMPAGEIPDVLRARAGKSVTLLLRSGKDFNDALVRIDDISAVEIRNR